MRRRLFGWLLPLVLVMAACDPGAREAAPFQGMWESEGWGTYLLIEGGSTEVFEHSAVHCLSAGGGGARGISEVLAFEDGRLVLRDGGRVIRFDPIDSLPEGCLEDDAVGVVAIAAATLEEQYAGELDSGWEQRKGELTAVSGDAQVLVALTDLLAPVGGAGLGVLAPDGGSWSGRPQAAIDPVPGDLVTIGKGGMVTGTLPDGAGYISFLRLGGFADDDEASQRAAASAIDSVLREHDRVVVDLRQAAGGALSHATLVASRFVSTETTVVELEARASSRFVDAGTMTVRPLQAGPYRGRVAFLIGPGSVGVAELLAAAVGGHDRIVLIGAGTSGWPGPPLVRALPGGWSLAVPNLRAITPEGKDLGGGVQPDIFAGDAMTAAIDWLDS